MTKEPNFSNHIANYIANYIANLLYNSIIVNMPVSGDDQ